MGNQIKRRPPHNGRRARMVDSSLARTKYLLSRFYESVGGPTALGLYLMVEAEDWDGLIRCSGEIDPLQYESTDDFADAYLATSFTKKLVGLPGFTPEDRARMALEKYLAVEDDLRQQRSHLKRIFEGSCTDSADLEALNVLQRARGKIFSLLGEYPDLDQVARGFRFGPGSSSSVNGEDVSVGRKMMFENLEVSTSCIPYLESFLNSSAVPIPDTGWRTKEYIKVITVPKTSKIDRVIGIEPDFNIFVQLGFGAYIRKRLKRVGLDLDHGHNVNRCLAAFGSRNGSVATVDLSAASDRIHKELVRFLLPTGWFTLLDMCRTPLALVGDYPFPLEKFSSMGNGFTFELETLIFWSISQSVVEMFSDQCSWDVPVFGDDIIVPTDCVHKLYSVFSTLGFKVNEDKSYSTGYFRESCGGHFFKGCDVKPLYLKELYHGRPEEIFKISNALRKYCHRRFGADILVTRFRGLYKDLVSQLPAKSRLRVPFGFGDVGLESFFDEALPKTRLANQQEGWMVRALVNRSKFTVHDTWSALYAVLFENDRQRPPDTPGWRAWLLTIKESVRRETPTGVAFPLRRSLGYRVGRIVVPFWDDPVVVR